MENKDENNDRENAMNGASLAELDTWFTEWFGAIFFFLVNFGKISFSELSQEKYKKRNIRVGWLVKMILLVGGIWMAWEFLSYFD